MLGLIIVVATIQLFHRELLSNAMTTVVSVSVAATDTVHYQVGGWVYFANRNHVRVLVCWSEIEKIATMAASHGGCCHQPP